MTDDNHQGPAELQQWISQSLGGHWRATGAMDQLSTSNDYLIDGILPRTGASVWFGAGSTGKTQVLIWMATAIAPSRSHVPAWLGHAINGTGHVVILSAEDTREQLYMRLRSVLTEMHGLSEDLAREVCSRIHVMPFISMTEEEFDRPNPSLFSSEGAWGPSETMKAIRVFITDWNKVAERPEDRIVGVVMDSATSMAGFDSNAADAVTNFFFYMNRLCQALDIFWIIIGHTPKAPRFDPNDPDIDAAARLRGVALWTTAPRTTIEVRLAQGPRFRGNKPAKGKKTAPFEAKPVLDAGLAASADEVVIVRLAKSNFHDSHRGKHFLVRRPGGMFEDVTHRLSPEAVDEADEEPDDEVIAAAVTLEDGTYAMWQLICALTDAKAGEAVSAHALWQKREEHIGAIPNLKTIKAIGNTDGMPREGALNWHLERLRHHRLLIKHGRPYKIAQDAKAIAGSLWPDRSTELNSAI